MGAWIAIAGIVLFFAAKIAHVICRGIERHKECQRLRQNVQDIAELARQRFGWKSVTILKEDLDDLTALSVNWLKIQAIYIGETLTGKMEWAAYEAWGFEKHKGGRLTEAQPMKRLTYVLEGPRGSQEVQVWWCRPAPPNYIEQQLRAVYPDYERQTQVA